MARNRLLILFKYLPIPALISLGFLLLALAILGVFKIILNISQFLAFIYTFLVTFGIFRFLRRYGYETFGIGPSHITPQRNLTKSHRKLRFVCISDTHNKHRSVALPPGDVLLHAGDFTNKGTLEEIRDFTEWLRSLPYKHKIVVAGNHELSLDAPFYLKNWKFWNRTFSDPDLCKKLLRESCTYLDNEFVVIDGIKIYGSPDQPEHEAMAFNRERGEELARIWSGIPKDTDVLLTHTPPYGHGDFFFADRHHIGDRELMRRVAQVQPRFHVFGHVHEGYGVSEGKGTVFINAASCSLLYRVRGEPIVFDL